MSYLKQNGQYGTGLSVKKIICMFSKITGKISSKTTRSMSQFISRQCQPKKNQQEPTKPKHECNCQKAHLPCVIGGKCVPGNVIYEGAVMTQATQTITQVSVNLVGNLDGKNLKLASKQIQNNTEHQPVWLKTSGC